MVWERSARLASRTSAEAAVEVEQIKLQLQATVEVEQNFDPARATEELARQNRRMAALLLLKLLD